MKKSNVLKSLAIVVMFVSVIMFLDTVISDEIDVEVVIEKLSLIIESDFFKIVSPIIIIMAIIVYSIRYVMKNRKGD